MKNIAFFAVFVSIVPSIYGISLHTGGGILYGRAVELVYASSSSSDLLSELVWPMEGLAYGELGFGFGRRRTDDFSFFAEGSVKLGLPGNTGTMTNADWISPSGYQTHYSAHDCFSERAILADCRLGFLFPLKDRLTLAPFMMFSTMSFSWIARDGYLQYGPNAGSGPYVPWNSSFAKVRLDGKGILYSQDWLILAFGLELGWDFTQRLSLKAALSVAPFIVCGAQDDHLLRNIRFNDVMTGGYALDPSLVLSYRLDARFSLFLRGAYRHIAGVRGDTSQEAIDTGEKFGLTKNTAGAGYSVFDLALGVRFVFLR